MIDGEGSVDPKQRKIFISNTDPSICEAIENCMRGLHIPFSKSLRSAKLKRKSATVYCICERLGIEIVLRHIPIRSADKIQRLEDAWNSYKYQPLGYSGAHRKETYPF